MSFFDFLCGDPEPSHDEPPKGATGNPRHSYWSDAAIRARGGNPRSSEYSDLAIRGGKRR